MVSFKFLEATGGAISTSGNYKIHKFTGSGTFQVTQLGDVGTVDYLVVAGGASGSNGTWGGGGGGAGGFRTAANLSVGEQSYSVTIGAGGAASNGYGNNGANSVFSSKNCRLILFFFITPIYKI